MVQHSEDPQRSWEKWQHRNDPPPPPPPPRRFPLEYRVPLLLAGLGLAVMIGAGAALRSRPDTFETAFTIGYILVLDIPLTILGLQLLGRFFKISYGPTGSAIIKLLCIAVFVEGLVFAGSLLAYPIIVRILLFPVSWYLFAVLFDLDPWDLVCSLIGLWVFHLLFWTVFWLALAPSILGNREGEQTQARALRVCTPEQKRSPRRRQDGDESVATRPTRPLGLAAFLALAA
jgi:hypothetical protein